MSGEYPVCVLLNKLTKRWHAIAFQQYLLCGQADCGRYKSIGHHTEGFDTIEEAVAEIRTHDYARLVGRIYEWDGLEMPAIVEFFGPPENESVDEVAAALIKAAGQMG